MGKREKYKIRFSSYKLQSWTVHVPIIVPLDYLCFKFGNRRAWLLITKNVRHYNYIGSKEKSETNQTAFNIIKIIRIVFDRTIKKILKILSDGKAHTPAVPLTQLSLHIIQLRTRVP